MNKHRNLSIISVAGLTSALAIGAFGAGALAADPLDGDAGMGATEMAMDDDRILLSGEYADGEDESEASFNADQTLDEVTAGARLILAYDPETNSFGGLIENTTDMVLEQVAVEIDLSNGTELGPTEPTDLAPGEVIEVVLPATDEPFESFSAHPEIGAEFEGEEYEDDDDHDEEEDDDDDDYEDDDEDEEDDD